MEASMISAILILYSGGANPYRRDVKKLHMYMYMSSRRVQGACRQRRSGQDKKALDHSGRERVKGQSEVTRHCLGSVYGSQSGGFECTTTTIIHWPATPYGCNRSSSPTTQNRPWHLSWQVQNDTSE